jgi:hypothetical protein
MIRSLLLIITGSVFLFLPSRIPLLAQSTAPNREELLTDAARILLDLPPEESISLLSNLSFTAESKYPKLSRKWAIQALEAARNLSIPTDRPAMEKNVLITLARIDLVEAERLYITQDAPSSQVGEDARADGADQLFNIIWAKDGKSGLPAIRRIALWLGETGQFPYRAIGRVISRLASENP